MSLVTRPIEFYIEGPKREETIQLPVLDTHFDRAVLSMNKTFSPNQMYLIEAKSVSNLLPTEIYSVGVVRHYNNVAKNQDARQHLKIVLKDALSKKPLPQRIVAKLLTNNDHWQLVMIDLKKGIEHPVVYVVNTTNMTKMESVPEIHHEYFEKFGPVLNEIFEELGCTYRIREDQIQYIQGLQYGNMSCGIATDLNFQKMSTLSNVALNEMVFQVGDIVRKEVHTQLQVGEEVFEDISFELDKEHSIDHSIRYSPVEDGVRRVEVYMDLCRRQSLKEELHSSIPSSKSTP